MGLVDAAARFLEPRLNRRTRSVTDRLIRGLLLALVIVSATVFVALVLAAIGAAIPYGWVLVLVLIFVLVRQRGPFEQARAMVRDLEGRSDSLGADVVNDAHRAARETIEALAARLADGPVAAAFWYALLGLPGLAGYWAISILATRLDERNPQYAAFGMAATRLNEAVLFLPGAITRFADRCCQRLCARRQSSECFSDDGTRLVQGLSAHARVRTRCRRRRVRPQPKRARASADRLARVDRRFGLAGPDDLSRSPAGPFCLWDYLLTQHGTHRAVGDGNVRALSACTVRLGGAWPNSVSLAHL